MDTTALAEGGTLFLSDINAGELVQTNPRIASSLGTVTKSAVAGAIHVKIDNLITYPQAVGFMRGQANPTYALSTTPVKLTGYTISDGVITNPDEVNGEIATPLNGIYNAMVAVAINYVSVASTRTAYLELYNETTMTVVGAMPMQLARDSVDAGTSFPATMSGVAGELYSLRLRADVAMNVTVVGVSFALTSAYLG